MDYLPASKTVPTPKAVLGDVAGAPGKLPYAEEVYQYMRMLEKASPRVKVYSIGKTEEGREMIAVAIASEAIMAKLQDNCVAPRQTRRPAHDQHGRCAGGAAHQRSDADLLHHRDDPLAGNRIADGADGAGLPADRRRPSSTSSRFATT